MDLNKIKAAIQWLPISEQTKQQLSQASIKTAQIVNPQENYTMDEAKRILLQNNINLGIIDNMLPLINNPIGEKIINAFSINKNNLINDLQALRENQPQKALTTENSAIFKELDQF